MSEQEDKFEEWLNLIKHLKDSQTALYDFRWESQVPASVLQGVKSGVKSFFKDITSVGLVLTRFLPRKVVGALGVVLGVGEVGYGIAKVFKQSKANAKVAGTLLGCTLALREPFHS